MIIFKKIGIYIVLAGMGVILFSGCGKKEIQVEPVKGEQGAIEREQDGRTGKAMEEKHAPAESKAFRQAEKAENALAGKDISTAYYFFNQALSRALDEEKPELLEKIAGFIQGLDPIVLEDILKSRTNNFPESMILYHLGLAYADDKKTAAAEKVLNRFLEKYPDDENAGHASEVMKMLREAVFNKYKIGCLLPLTGKFKVFGQKALKGIEFAVMEMSRKYEQDVKVLIRDTGSDHAQAGRMMNSLLNKNVAAVAGPMITAETAAGIAEKNRVPIVVMTQKEKIALKGGYVFSNFISPEMQVRALVSYAFKDLGVRRFAALYPEDRYGKTCMNLFWDMVDEIGGCMVGAESYSSSQTDFADIIKKLTGTYYPLPHFLQKGALGSRLKYAEGSGLPREDYQRHANEEEAVVDFQAVFIPDSASKVSMIVPQLAYHDAAGIYLLGTNIWHHPGLLREAAGFMNKSIITEGFFAQISRKRAAVFAEKFKRLYSNAPGFIEACACDTITLLAEAALDPSVNSHKTLRDALKNRVFDGVTGTSMFDENGNSQNELFFITVKKGQFTEIRR
ncbi:MAG: penicillin-binding protein activator [Thermodesulfobacteriota bacterium]|nr:penicillin-binding protein activator [Thermodesulfobacteriota bacterium]